MTDTGREENSKDHVASDVVNPKLQVPKDSRAVLVCTRSISEQVTVHVNFSKERRFVPHPNVEFVCLDGTKSVVAKGAIKKDHLIMVESPFIGILDLSGDGLGTCCRYLVLKDIDLLFEKELSDMMPRSLTDEVVDDLDAIGKKMPPRTAVRVSFLYERVVRNSLVGSYGQINMYEYASYIDHSCVPNATWFIDAQSCLSITSLKNITPGEPITILYDDKLLKYKNNITRKKAILRNLGFICNCIKCIKVQI